MTKKEQPKIDEAFPVVNVTAGKTFYDWMSGRHDTFKYAAVGTAAVVGIIVTGLVSWIIPVFFIAALFVGYLILRNAFLDVDSVRLVASSDEDPARLDILLIGKERFKKMNKSGMASPLANSDGDPVFFAENYSGNDVRFSWIHDCSRLQFLMKSKAFDSAVELAEGSAEELYKIRNIPNILALKKSGEYIRQYEAYYDRILNDDDDSVFEDAAKELKQSQEAKE